VGAPAGPADRPGETQWEELLGPAHPAPVGAPAAELAAAGWAARLGRQHGADSALKHGLDLGLGNPYDQHVVFGEGPRSRNQWGPLALFCT
jgi:hypothetical protein